MIFVKAIFHVALLFITLLKTLHFFRTFERFGLLTHLIFNVVRESWAFSLFYVLSIGFFSLVFISLGMEEPKENYPQLSMVQRFFVSTSKSALGDLQDPQYTSWNNFADTQHKKFDFENFKQQSRIMIVLIYTAWYLNIFFNLVLLLNFLIAAISESHQRYMRDREALKYIQRQDMIQEVVEIGSLFVFKD